MITTREQPRIEDDYRRIEPTSDGQAKVFFRYYGEWVHADTMGYAAAVALQPEWYSYQRREYMLSRN